MKSLLFGIQLHMEEQGFLKTLRWLCRKGREKIVKTGYVRYRDWPSYFKVVRSKSSHRNEPIDEKWIEFICPFHRGDTIVGLLCANVAAMQGKQIRMYVANGLKKWLSDFQVHPNVTLIELTTKLPTALETQPRYNKALHESVQKPEATGRFVSYRSIGKLEDEGLDLVEYILRQLDLPRDTRLPQIPIANCDNSVKLDLKTGDRPFILLHPQAGWRIKSLSPKIISQIIQTTHKINLQVIQIGGEKDNRVNGADKYILENLSISEWAYLFRKANAIIGADTWTAHFASLLDINQIIIYGATEDRTVGLKRHMEKRNGRFMIFESSCDLQPCTKLYCRKGTKYCQKMKLNQDALEAFLLETAQPNRSISTI